MYQTFAGATLTAGESYVFCIDAAAADETGGGGLASLVYEYSWYNSATGDQTVVTQMADLYTGDFSIDGVAAAPNSQIASQAIDTGIDWDTYCAEILIPSDAPSPDYDFRLYISNGGLSPDPAADLLLDNFSLVAVPEPSTLLLLGFAGCGLARRSRSAG